MQLDEMKKGLWGYQKASVFQYVAAREEEFSRRLLEKDQQAEQAARQYQERIQALEQEGRELRAELEELRRRQSMISDALLDAQAFSERMKAETQAQEQSARERLRQELDVQTRELNSYRDQVSALRRALQDTLRDLETQTGQLERQIEVLEGDRPQGNLTLFQRREAQESAV